LTTQSGYLQILNAYAPEPYPTRAIPLHQEAIYEIAEEKYFGGEEFLRLIMRMAACSRAEIHEAEKSKMKNDSNYSFAIIRFNEKTYMSGGVVAVVQGTESAQRTLNDFEWCQSQEDRGSGWRYFVEETDLQPGIDPAKATRLRQLRFDLQESQAKSF
jgi:hypothetical protein